MSVVKPLSGRKRDSLVWDYFVFDEIIGKSRCLVATGKDNVCGKELKGKNSSNLFAHLERFHTAEYAVYEAKEGEKRKNKQGVNCQLPADSTVSVPARKLQTLESCIHRNITAQPKDSNEHKELASGRKRESLVWDYFSFNEIIGKSKCLVAIGKDNVCDKEFEGKNSSNLVAHLRRYHSAEHAAYAAKEGDRQKNKQGVKRRLPAERTVSVPARKLKTTESRIHINITAWPNDSNEYKERMTSVMKMVIDTNSPMTLVDNLSFRSMLKAMDSKFNVPGSVKFISLMRDQFEAQSAKLKCMLTQSRKVTICLDGWTKKNLSASFLSVSACFFDAASKRPVHAFLQLADLQHPHTGEKLSECLIDILKKWGITEEKVLLVVSDNGANMLKATRLMQAEHVRVLGGGGEVQDVERRGAENVEDEDEGDSEEEDGGEEEGHRENGGGEDDCDQLELPHVPFRRMPCLAHTLQLVVKLAYSYYGTVLFKARRLVSRVRKSSVAMEKLNQRCGKSLVADCMTRWNSTHQVIERLIAIKMPINDVLAEMKIDSLAASEWAQLEEVASLLQPFASLTDVLQSDAQALSSIIPSLLDLECHLQQHSAARTLTAAMLCDLRMRFQTIFQPCLYDFNPLPAAACLLDPTLCAVLMEPELADLMQAAKMYIVEVCGSAVVVPASKEQQKPASSSHLQQFKFLANKMKARESTSASTLNNESMMGQLNRYFNDAKDAGAVKALDFWSTRRSSYVRIAELAEDLLAAPASQAYVERIFSLCGLLTVGRRNSMWKSLDMRVFLKLNNNIV